MHVQSSLFIILCLSQMSWSFFSLQTTKGLHNFLLTIRIVKTQLKLRAETAYLLMLKNQKLRAAVRPLLLPHVPRVIITHPPHPEYAQIFRTRSSQNMFGS